MAAMDSGACLREQQPAEQAHVICEWDSVKAGCVSSASGRGLELDEVVQSKETSQLVATASSPLSESAVPSSIPSEDSSTEARHRGLVGEALERKTAGVSPVSSSCAFDDRCQSMDGTASPYDPSRALTCLSPKSWVSSGQKGGTDSLPTLGEAVLLSCEEQERPAVPGDVASSRSWKTLPWWRTASVSREPEEVADKRLQGNRSKWTGFSMKKSWSSMNIPRDFSQPGGEPSVKAKPALKDITFRNCRPTSQRSKWERFCRTKSTPGTVHKQEASTASVGDATEIPPEQEGCCAECACMRAADRVSRTNPSVVHAHADRPSPARSFSHANIAKFGILTSPQSNGQWKGAAKEDVGASGTANLSFLASPLGLRVNSFRSTCSISSISTSWQPWEGASSRRWEEDAVGSQSARWSTGGPEPSSRNLWVGGLQEEDDFDVEGELSASQHQFQEHGQRESQLHRQDAAGLEGQQHFQQNSFQARALSEPQQPAHVSRAQPLRLRGQQGQMIHEILSDRTQSPHHPSKLLGKALRLGKGKLGPGGSSSPLNILVAQRGALKEHLGRFLLDAQKLEVGDVLAVGSSGEVRRGRYEDKDVAIKVLKVDGDSSRDGASLPGRQGILHVSALMVRAEFRREVLALMQTAGNCKQLLPLVGVTVDIRQRLCIVTKFMPGGTLYELLQRSRRSRAHKKLPSGAEPVPALPLPQLLAIAQDVATGMQFLHDHDIMHRDLKSGNVFLESDGNSAVVGDLGVARLKGERGEMTKEVGTYRWMAPEVFGTSAWPVTSKSDVYSYGVLLWEMVSGDIPYEGYTPVQAAVAVALSGLRPSIPDCCPPELAALICNCWDKDPQMRPAFSDIVRRLTRMRMQLGLLQASSEA